MFYIDMLMLWKQKQFLGGIWGFFLGDNINVIIVVIYFFTAIPLNHHCWFLSLNVLYRL